jgi:GNAT superfamily N-acetyltransferase
MLEIRTLREGDVDAVADLNARVFGKDEADREQIRTLTRAAHRGCPFVRPELCWVAEVDGRIVMQAQLLDLEVRLGSVAVRTGGLQGVVAEPGYRGRGYPLQMYAVGLPQALAHGFDLFLGFAQRGALYQRFGGGAPVMPDYELGLDVARVEGLAVDRFWPMGEPDLDAMLEHYARANAGRSGSLVRTRELWPWLVRRPPRVLMHPEGYLGYRLAEDAVEVRELGGSGEAFYDEALRKLAALARERGLRRVRGHVPPDDPLVARAAAYGCEHRVTYSRRSGCLARVARAGPLLERLVPELEARLARSPLAGARVQLAIDCDGERWARSLGPPGGAERHAKLSLPAGALTQLLFGTLPPRQVLFDHGAAADPSGLEALEALFPRGWPFMWHGDRF